MQEASNAPSRRDDRLKVLVQGVVQVLISIVQGRHENQNDQLFFICICLPRLPLPPRPVSGSFWTTTLSSRKWKGKAGVLAILLFETLCMMLNGPCSFLYSLINAPALPWIVWGGRRGEEGEALLLGREELIWSPLSMAYIKCEVHAIGQGACRRSDR